MDYYWEFLSPSDSAVRIKKFFLNLLYLVKRYKADKHFIGRGANWYYSPGHFLCTAKLAGTGSTSSCRACWPPADRTCRPPAPAELAYHQLMQNLQITRSCIPYRPTAQTVWLHSCIPPCIWQIEIFLCLWSESQIPVSGITYGAINKSGPSVWY